MPHFPTLSVLERIIPVAQSQTRDDTTLTLLSIDCYSDGWVTNLRVYHPEPDVFPVFQFYPRPDTRRAYEYGGGYGPSPWRHRKESLTCYLSQIWYPPLTPDSVPLRFVVNVVRFTDRPRKEGGILVSEVRGPWTFSIDPLGGIVAEEREPSVPQYKSRGEWQSLRTSIGYGPVFDALLEIFYKYDPQGKAWISPLGAEWYTPITVEILRGLEYALYPQDVRDILIHEFRHWWNLDVQRNPRFEELANDVWQAWLREGQANESPH